MISSDPLAVEERLFRMAALMTQSIQNVMRIFDSGVSNNSTGFIAYNPAGLCRLMLNILRLVENRRPASLDLGCGNGGWTLMAAAAGFPSFGIDISPFLIGHARRNCRAARASGLIAPETQCEFIVGDMYPAAYRPTQTTASEEPAPEQPASDAARAEIDPYELLGMSVAHAGIIYAYAWPKQMPALCRFLAATVRPDTILVLPVYATGDYNQHLRLKSLDPDAKHFCIGTKI